MGRRRRRGGGGAGYKKRVGLSFTSRFLKGLHEPSPCDMILLNVSSALQLPEPTTGRRRSEVVASAPRTWELHPCFPGPLPLPLSFNLPVSQINLEHLLSTSADS